MHIIIRVACATLLLLAPAQAQGKRVKTPKRPVLQQGDKGDAVGLLQLMLNDTRRLQRLKPVGTDCAFGPQTRGALRDFQRAAGVNRTGVTDKKTWKALLELSRKGPLGRIDPTATPVTDDRYAMKKGKPVSVLIHLLPAMETRKGVRAQPILFHSKMTIDADGDGDAWKSDPWGQPETSLQYRGGRSVNPTTTPYFVLPIGFDKHHEHMRLGDIAAVIYRGKVTFAIYADRGPRGRIGEGSIKLAEELGINASPTKGGVGSGVIYIVFPGSGTRRPQERDAIRRIGATLFRRAGGRFSEPATPARG